jgi:hypothetical protein
MSPYFRDEFAATDLGTRTKKLAELVGKELGDALDKDAASGLAQIFTALGKGKKAEAGAKKAGSAEGDDEGAGEAGDAHEDEEEGSEKTAHLLFLSQGEVESVAEFARKNIAKLKELAAKVAEEGPADVRHSADALSEVVVSI